MALNIINGPIIQPGESLSEGIDCSGGNIVRLTMPAGWTPANISFAISSDGSGYNDLFDTSGREIVMAIKTSTAVVIDASWSKALGWLKIRSGTRDYPVPQEVQRDFAVAIELPESAAPSGQTQRRRQAE